LRLREHPSITDQDDPGEAEPIRELGDLIRDGAGVAGVAGIDLHRHGTSFGIGQDAIDDDRPAGLAVAVMAVPGQGTGLPLVVAAADVVEDQAAVGQMPLSTTLSTTPECVRARS
jgi:hypothetical protein